MIALVGSLGAAPATDAPDAPDAVPSPAPHEDPDLGAQDASGSGRAVAGGVITALGDVGRTTGCRPPLELRPAVGCVRGVGDGLWEVHGPDGSIATTHGPDIAPDHDDAADDHDGGHTHLQEPAFEAASAATSLPSRRRSVVCAPDGSPRTVVLYAHLRGTPDRLANHRSAIEANVERSNELLARSGRASGGPELDLRVACGGSGQVAVSSVAVASRAFGDVKASLAAAGYDQRDEKYLIYGDFRAAEANYAGIADLFIDARRRESNLNNGGRPMYALVYGADRFAGPTALHELAHTMGAVQRDAPHADGAGHCRVGDDVLCYPTTSTRCNGLVLDCGNDSYLSTATRPGQWLHDHWNLGWEGNRFVHVAGRSSQADVPFRDTASSPHRVGIEGVARRGIAGGYADGTFRPEQPVTRAHMASFLQRARSLTTGHRHGFRDISGNTHESSISAVAHARVAHGYPDRTYRPGVAVTRGQMAAFLTRAFSLPPATGSGFSDARGTTHADAISAVAAAGVAHGYNDGTFRPHDPVTRGQMATFLWRALGR